MGSLVVHARRRARRLATAAIMVIVGALTMVGPAVPRVAAQNAATDCVLPMKTSTSDAIHSMGALNFDNFVRPIGTVKAIMLFVDFPDAPATSEDDTVMDAYFSPDPGDWLSTSSYGRLNLVVTPIRHWLRISEPLATFQFGGKPPAGTSGKRYITDALKAADAEVNFADYRIVIIIANKEATTLLGGNTRTYDPAAAIPIDGTLVRTVVTLGSTDYKNGWGPGIVDHEVGHAFGVTDYYSTGAGVGLYTYAGSWSIMSDDFNHNDHVAFDKWRFGWLTNDQVRCLNDETDDDFVLSPLAADDDGLKAVILRTGLQSAIVAEYRTLDGNDANVCSEGVLIYRIDNLKGNGAGAVRVVDANPGTATGTSGCKAEVWDAPYADGETFSDAASGIEISVDSTGDGEADIHVSRTSTYTAPVRYGRSLTIKSVRNANGTTLISGVLTASRHLAACQAARSVSLQRRVGTVWLTVRTANTSALAQWAYTSKAKPGLYRLYAPDFGTSSYDCLPTFSKSVTVK